MCFNQHFLSVIGVGTMAGVDLVAYLSSMFLMDTRGCQPIQESLSLSEGKGEEDLIQVRLALRRRCQRPPIS